MNEQDIPIDIHTGKLQEWLVSRRIVQKNWHTAIPDIRDKINNAIKDMPEDESLVRLLSGAHINYFHCVQIIDILKRTEAETKNVFGIYKSQRMKDWQEVTRLYERDSIYLAEAAQILVRNIQYEIPSIRKQITKFEQLSDEADKKVHDLLKSETVIKSEYTQLCQQLGIGGQSIKSELLEKLNDLPAIYNKIALLFPSLNKSVSLYTEFAGSIDALGLIRHISSFGNTTIYQFLYSEAPIDVEEPELKINVNEDIDKDERNAIDFGDEINMDDIKIEDVNLEVGDIDWGNADAEVDYGDQIDLDVNLEESGIVVEEDGHTGGIAKGDEAYRLLDFPEYRDRIIDELMELESFLKMRLYELSTSNNSSIIAVSLLEAYSEHSVENIEEMLQFVDVVLSQITEPLVQHLHQIKHSSNYVNILTDKLKQKLKAIEKIKANVELLKKKSKDFIQQAKELRPTQSKIIDQTKLLQEQIERDISKRYKNRVVNLMGGVNTI